MPVDSVPTLTVRTFADLKSIRSWLGRVVLVADRNTVYVDTRKQVDRWQPLPAYTEENNMTEQRIPKVGEVWRSSWGVESTIHAVVGDRLATTYPNHVNSDATTFAWPTIDYFLANHRPPSEPWEHPQPGTQWRTVTADGKLGTAHVTAETAASYVRDVTGVVVCPAIVECTVTPIDGTLKQVKP